MPPSERAELIRVRGVVQGVGLRPTVWRLARRHGLRGWVGNDGGGVMLCVSGMADDIELFVAELHHAAPPLARIDALERTPSALPDAPDFHIIESHGGEIRTGVAPDAAICAACRDEIADPAARRYRYPFTTCTHCGPRLSIIQAIPYDRATTTMRAFRMCAACAAEYADPADRRFHAQPIACADCGPRVWLQPAAPGDAPGDALGDAPGDAPGDTLAASRGLLLDGQILAIKALGGFHLACDATNAAAVARLRRRKRRDAKPFALMARDISVIRRHAVVSAAEAAALQSPAAPIVLLQASATPSWPGVAPGLSTLGFMLPMTPLHDVLLKTFDRPLVMTSGNLSDEPQCIANDEALGRLDGIADYVLLHDRDIACRLDDSIVRVMADAPRVLRRARGYAPAPFAMPVGFAAAAPLLAMGAELKSSFCLLRDGQAVLSHHLGDLENAAAFAEYRRSIAQYQALFVHAPSVIAVDRHPDYLSTRLGLEWAARDGLRAVAVQHHHAHFAACMAENGVPLHAGPMLGIVLDGLGWGDDGTIWGGEFLYGDYCSVRRVACLKPVAMPGGAQAIREPWRNTLAQILAGMGWDRFETAYAQTDLYTTLREKPLPVLAAMIARAVNAPLSSACGRLFDAVAVAAGLCGGRADYEGQAAMLLEAAAAEVPEPKTGYPLGIAATDRGLLHLDPAPLWPALFDDLLAAAPAGLIAARFHAGLAEALSAMVARLALGVPVALSGGVLQNRLLLEGVLRRLRAQGITVLTHREVPPNDGGLSLGQAAVAAARTILDDVGD